MLTRPFSFGISKPSGNKPFVFRNSKIGIIVICCQNCSDHKKKKKNCSSDLENILKFEAVGREFLQSLKQFIQTVKGQNSIW